MISKCALDIINNNLREKLKVNQWKETNEVINWFGQITEKSEHKFIMFDIKDFYPSITKKLLTDALSFAEKHIFIIEEDKQIIYHSRKTLLYNENQARMKKGDDLFDVTMGAYDGAEVCELVGLYILEQLWEKYNKNENELYREDGLAAFKGINSQQCEKIKKRLPNLI